MITSVSFELFKFKKLSSFHFITQLNKVFFLILHIVERGCHWWTRICAKTNVLEQNFTWPSPSALRRVVVSAWAIWGADRWHFVWAHSIKPACYTITKIAFWQLHRRDKRIKSKLLILLLPHLKICIQSLQILIIMVILILLDKKKINEIYLEL